MPDTSTTSKRNPTVTPEEIESTSERLKKGRELSDLVDKLSAFQTSLRGREDGQSLDGLTFSVQLTYPSAVFKSPSLNATWQTSKTTHGSIPIRPHTESRSSAADVVNGEAALVVDLFDMLITRLLREAQDALAEV